MGWWVQRASVQLVFTVLLQDIAVVHNYVFLYDDNYRDIRRVDVYPNLLINNNVTMTCLLCNFVCAYNWFELFQ